MKNGVHTDKRGTKRWYLNGKYHREDGPAIEYSNGAKRWYLNGKYHREDGPAVIWPDGDKWWWLNDREYSLDDWLNKLEISEEDKLALTLKCG